MFKIMPFKAIGDLAERIGSIFEPLWEKSEMCPVNSQLASKRNAELLVESKIKELREIFYESVEDTVARGLPTGAVIFPYGTGFDLLSDLMAELRSSGWSMNISVFSKEDGVDFYVASYDLDGWV